MATKFLDKTGLSHFWSKIKAWCNATFAAITHSHAWSTITGKPTTISGYGITDAKIANGTITLGSNSITPLTSHQALPTLSKTSSGSGNAVTDISVSNHAITVTKGSTFLTSHQSLDGKMTRGSYERIEGTSSAHKDLNSYTTAGFYNVKTANVDNCPSGIGIDAVLLVYPWNAGTYCTQELTESAASSDVRRWVRKYNQSTWTDWKQLAFQSSIPSIPNLSLTTSGSGNAITALSVSNHAITVTKGTTFLTSHQSLSHLVPQVAAALPTGNLAQDGLQLVEVYNNDYPYNYGNVINVQGTKHRGAGQLFLAWSGNNNGIANIYYRNKRDSITTWSDWKQIAFTDSSITGNAATATKLGTSTIGSSVQPIYLNQGTATAVNSALKSCSAVVESEAVTNNIFKIASGSMNAAYNGLNIVILIQNIMGVNAAIWRISLNVGATAGVYSAGTSVLVDNIGLDPANFIVAYKSNSGGSLNFELYVKITARYSGYRFTVIQECWRNSQKLGNILTLYNQLTSTGTAAITSGYTAITTSKASVNMDISGNAATATKLVTARTINGVSFDGSANITVADSTKVAKTGDIMTGMLKIKYTSITRGTAPSANAYPFFVEFRDNADKVLGGLYYEYFTNKIAKTHLMCYQGTTNANTWSSIGIGYDASGNVYTWAPTPATSDYSAKIATTEFVKAQGYLTSLNGILKNTIALATISTIPSSDTFKTIWECYSQDNKLVADFYVARNTYSDGWTAAVLRSRCSNGTSDNHAYLHLWCNKDGSDKYVTFPTPEASSNTDAGATTAWVRTFCDTTQKYMKAVSVTGSGNAVTAASLSNGTLTLTKGTTFLTSHQSLDSCVKTSGDQTISGTKTFNYRIMGTLGYKHTGIDPSSNPSSNQYCTIWTVEDKNGNFFNETYTGYLTSGENSTAIRTWRKDRGASNSWFVSMPNGVSRGYSYGNLYKDMVFINNNADLGTKPSSTQWWSLAFQDKDGESFGGAWFNASTGGACEYVIRCNTNLASGGVTKSIWIYQNQDKTSAAGITADTFRPTLKTFAKLGDTGDSRWGQIYSTSSTISTSDERQKCEIAAIPDEILDAWETCEFYQYKMKDSVDKKGNNARYHTGMIAQRLDAKFKTVNKDLDKYGLFCYDEWDASEARLDENGNITEPAVEAGNEYSIRYEEALCMEAAYQRRKNKILENRIFELEKRLAKLEGIV